MPCRCTHSCMQLYNAHDQMHTSMHTSECKPYMQTQNHIYIQGKIPFLVAVLKIEHADLEHSSKDTLHINMYYHLPVHTHTCTYSDGWGALANTMKTSCRGSR